MNPLTQYFVPQWLSIVFLFVIPLPFVVITLFVNKEAKKSQNKFALPVVISFYILYLCYIFIASANGWFNVVSFPPKVLLFTTFPYAFLLFGVVLRTKTYQNITNRASLQSIVGLHIFRVIGVFFVLLAVHNALPKPFAYIAGFGDIITAISSVFVAKAIENKKAYAKKLTLFWNIFGAADIIFTAVGANVLTKISIDTGALGVDTLAVFPFCIIPAFAPPTILLLHWAIFKKLQQFSS